MTHHGTRHVSAFILGLLCLCLHPSAYGTAQEAWEWQHPLPQGNTLFDVVFVSATNGYAAADGGTILRTTDAGLSWTVQRSPVFDTVRAIAFFDSLTGIAVGNTGVILRTSNAGARWIQVGSGTSAHLAGIHTAGPGVAVAVGENGTILRTHDHGRTWTAIATSQTKRLHSIDFTRDGDGVIVGTDGTALTSHDGGVTWEVRSTGTTEHLRRVCFLDDDTCIAAGTTGMIVRSKDRGRNWSPVEPSPPGLVPTWEGVSFRGRTGAFVGESGRILVTTDGGWDGWRAAPYTRPLPATLRAVAAIDTALMIAAGDNGAIVRTTDAWRSWDYVSTYSSQWLQGVSFADARHGMAVGYTAVLYTSDGGAHWVHRPVDDGVSRSAVLCFDDTTATAVTMDGRISITTDAGLTWTYIHVQALRNIFALDFPTRRTGYAVGHGGYMWKTSDGGASWTAMVSGTTESLRGVAFSSEDVGTAVGRKGTILRTTDGGMNWFAQGKTVSGDDDAIAVACSDDRTVFAVGAGGMILRTKNGGITWQRLDPGLTTTLNAIRLIDSNSCMIAGEGGLILRSTDGGDTWTRQDAGTRHPLHGITFISPLEGWVVGWNGTILHTRTGGVLGASDTRKPLPSSSFLQNHPNPFTRTTTFTYILDRPGHVTIRMYNMLGQQVGQITRDGMPSGTHTTSWDAGSLPTGIYLVVLQQYSSRISRVISRVR